MKAIFYSLAFAGIFLALTVTEESRIKKLEADVKSLQAQVGLLGKRVSSLEKDIKPLKTEAPAAEPATVSPAVSRRVQERRKAITQPAATESSKPWRRVAQWQGKAKKNTETFNISSSEWRIRWSTKSGHFSIATYTADGSYIDLVVNIIGENKDSSIMRGAGDYYLTISASQPYIVIVEEKPNIDVEVQ